MLPYGRALALPFLALGLALVVVGWGWLHRRKYAWDGTLTIIGINLRGDLARADAGEWLVRRCGVAAAGLLLVYSARPAIRARFS